MELEIQSEPDSTSETQSPPVATTRESSNTKEDVKQPFKYDLDEKPPWHVSLLCAIQLVLANITPPMLTVKWIWSHICGSHDNLLYAELLSTSIFMMGVATFLQVTFGVRLPILQGSSMGYILAVTSMMTTQQWICPPLCTGNGTTLMVNSTLAVEYFGNGTVVPCDNEAWRPRLLAISGSLMGASAIHCALGLTGAVGFLQKYIGPLTIAPTLGLIGLALGPEITEDCSRNWGVSLSTAAVYVISGVVLARFKVPLPVSWSRDKGLSITRIPIFQLFPVLFAVLVGWLICWILTVTSVLPDDPKSWSYPSRTDARSDAIQLSKWVFVPYPGYWGTPTFSSVAFTGLLAVVALTVFESMSDYYATAAICQAPTPPKHAMNRGIAVEGFASFLSGLLGACHATTSYSTILATLAITKVSSRFVFQCSAIIFVICGLFGKFGAVISTCPDPVIGAIAVMALGMVTSAGISTLRHCDMTSARNLAILGTSLMAGVMMPKYMKENPGIIQTGNHSLNDIIEASLSFGMLVGCVVGFVMDNLIPGTKEERGLVTFLPEAERTAGDDEASSPRPDVYDFPWNLSFWLRKSGRWTSYVPVLPQYTSRPIYSSIRRYFSRKS